MKITRTIELDENDRQIVEKFLEMTDRISNVVGCSMEDVYDYFVEQAVISGDDEYSITALHQIKDIG